MTDWSSSIRKPGIEAGDDASLEARHQLLIDLLAAYLDGELPAETQAQIEAHLVGCARCRRELRLQDAVRTRLGAEPPMAAAPSLHARIAAAVAAAPAPVFPAPTRDIPRRAWLLVPVLIAALGIGGYALLPRAPANAVSATPLRQLPAAASTVPLFNEVLADYRRVTMTDLPGRSRDLEVVRRGVPFPVEALRAPGLRLVGAWTTDIGGDPAAVLAYRLDDRVVLEYLVPEERFFRHPAVRNAIADGHGVRSTDGGQGLIAWPVARAGAILVGETPLGRLERIPDEDRLARTSGRGAE